jgi:hypothetical protein
MGERKKIEKKKNKPGEKESGLFYFSCYLILIDLFIMYDLIE